MTPGPDPSRPGPDTPPAGAPGPGSIARARRIGGRPLPTPPAPGSSGTHHGPVAAPTPVTTGSPVPAQSEVAPKPASRAGRNLGAAIGVGLGLGAVIVLTLTLYRPSFAVLVAVAAGYGCWELAAALRVSGVRIAVVPLLAGTAAISAASWFAGPNGLVAGVLLTGAALLAWCVADGADGTGGRSALAAAGGTGGTGGVGGATATTDAFPRRAGASLLVLLYVPTLAGFAVLSAHASDGAARILAFAVVVVCSDTGGYATGVLFGRHPLAPVVSKGKTWEGFAGSVAACSAAGVLLLTLTFHEAWWKGLLFGLALVVTATLGDLGESMIKRDLGVKDMGALLPGHGGLMDRLDSMLPCAAVGYLLLSLFAPM